MSRNLDINKIKKLVDDKIAAIRHIILNTETTPKIALFLEELNKEYRIGPISFFIEELQHMPNAYIDIHRAQARYLLREELFKKELELYYIERCPNIKILTD